MRDDSQTTGTQREKPQPLWTEREVAEFLSYSRRTVRRWRREGLLPAIAAPSGRGYRYRPQAILAAVTSWESL